MSDLRDVMAARSTADSDLRNADAYGGMIEDGRTGDVALASLLAARAICSELRALGTIIDYQGDKRARA